MNLLVDTNIILYLLQGDKKISTILSESVIHLSFITELELLSYPNLKESEYDAIQSLLDESILYDVNSQIKKSCLVIRKKYSLKFPDALIAATAQSYDLTLFTNDTDFNKVDELDLIKYQT